MDWMESRCAAAISSTSDRSTWRMSNAFVGRSPAPTASDSPAISSSRSYRGTTQEERRGDQVVDLRANSRDEALPLGFEKETQSANRVQAGRLGRAPRRTVVKDDRDGADLDGEGNRFPLAVAEPSWRREDRGTALGCPHRSPLGQDRNRRRNLAHDGRRNQDGRENGRNEIEALNLRERDQRTGV